MKKDSRNSQVTGTPKISRRPCLTDRLYCLLLYTCAAQ